jgi:hypothetical protein
MFMNFRSFHPRMLFSIAAGVALSLALPVQAKEDCGGPDANGARLCSAGLSAEMMQEMVAVQEHSQWCWAAAISMIFAHYGFQVAQQEIVKDGYGVAADLPAPSGQAMTNAISRAWTDMRNRPFRARVLASDALGRQYQVTNDRVVVELIGGRPLLVGAMRHAVVLVGLSYQRRADGRVRIVSGTVIDPQPGQGVRPLLRGEMKPTYVAAVQIEAPTLQVAALTVSLVSN